MWPWLFAAAAFAFQLHSLNGVERRLRASLIEQEKKMSAALDRITQEVTESRQATQAILALVSGLADQIRENATDPAALEALADELDAQQAEIAAAVTANTPTEPEQPEE